MINQKDLEIKIGIANVADRTQYYSSEFKKINAKYKSVININLAEFLLKTL